MATKPKRQPEWGVILVAGGRQLSRRDWRRYQQVGLAPNSTSTKLVFNWSDRKVKDLASGIAGDGALWLAEPVEPRSRSIWRFCGVGGDGFGRDRAPVGR